MRHPRHGRARRWGSRHPPPARPCLALGAEAPPPGGTQEASRHLRFFHTGREAREAFHFKRKAIMGEPLSPRLKAKVVTALGEKHADKQDVVFAALRSDWVTCTASGPCAPAEALPRSFPRVLAAR